MAVLSRRWRRLPGMLPRLVIDAREFEPAGIRAGGHARTKRAMERVAGAVESLLPGDRAIERLRLYVYLLRDESYTVRRVFERLNDAVGSGKVAAGGLELMFMATGEPDPEPSKRQARRLTRLLASSASPSSPSSTCGSRRRRSRPSSAAAPAWRSSGCTSPTRGSARCWMWSTRS
uniref:Uncharacterized protein n=1 Tax=Oryza punctata TaxID=4537 RepID=A0A0E0LMT6_ORYPU